LATDRTFPALVNLACHDLRTPLATVRGFAKTLVRLEPLTERTAKHLKMIEEAAGQMSSQLEQLALVSRIEEGKYDPTLQQVDSLELARAAGAKIADGSFAVGGLGSPVTVDVEAVERALAAFADCALRHGGLERVALQVEGAEIRISPTTVESAPVLIGEELRDLGSAAAHRLVEALGGSVSLDEDALLVRLPQ
jgi:signal transduction histidine kinase